MFQSNLQMKPVPPPSDLGRCHRAGVSSHLGMWWQAHKLQCMENRMPDDQTWSSQEHPGVFLGSPWRPRTQSWGSSLFQFPHLSSDRSLCMLPVDLKKYNGKVHNQRISGPVVFPWWWRLFVIWSYTYLQFFVEIVLSWTWFWSPASCCWGGFHHKRCGTPPLNSPLLPHMVGTRHLCPSLGMFESGPGCHGDASLYGTHRTNYCKTFIICMALMF